MPRIEDYPETFEQNQRPAPAPAQPLVYGDPRAGYQGGYMGEKKQRQAPVPAPPPVYGGPGGGYQGGYGTGHGTSPTPIPVLSSTDTGVAHGGDLDPYGPSESGPYGGTLPPYRQGGSPYGNRGGFNAGMAKPGGMMNPMTLGQLNRRRPY